jgi:hypothetical protein
MTPDRPTVHTQSRFVIAQLVLAIPLVMHSREQTGKLTSWSAIVEINGVRRWTCIRARDVYIGFESRSKNGAPQFRPHRRLGDLFRTSLPFTAQGARAFRCRHMPGTAKILFGPVILHSE